MAARGCSGGPLALVSVGAHFLGCPSWLGVSACPPRTLFDNHLLASGRCAFTFSPTVSLRQRLPITSPIPTEASSCALLGTLGMFPFSQEMRSHQAALIPPSASGRRRGLSRVGSAFPGGPGTVGNGDTLQNGGQQTLPIPASPELWISSERPFDRPHTLRHPGVLANPCTPAQ